MLEQSRKLTNLEKALLAAKVWHDLSVKRISPDEAGEHLRHVIKKNLSVVQAAQYLTGAKALDALERFPEDATYEGLSKMQIIVGVTLAHSVCANASASGKPMSGAALLEYFKQER